jgi:hypothetical protein
MRNGVGHFGLGAFLPTSGFGGFVDLAVPELRRREVFRSERVAVPDGDREDKPPLAREKQQRDLRHVSKTFPVDTPVLRAFDGVDLVVAPGESCCSTRIVK